MIRFALLLLAGTSVFFALNCCDTKVRADDYQVTREKTEELKRIAEDLRSEFHDSLLKSHVIYGQLIFQTVRVKMNARTIHLRAKLQWNCDWEKEIGKIEDAICEMETLMIQAQRRSASGIDRPLDQACVACIYQLLGQARFVVQCLMIDGGFVQPASINPIIGPAPGFEPRPGIELSPPVLDTVVPEQIQIEPTPADTAPGLLRRPIVPSIEGSEPQLVPPLADSPAGK